jgi:glucan phosphoethanolaminetransferase (alkaline phosphatase superfamily)
MQVWELGQHIKKRNMNSKIKISQFDVKSSQLSTWIITIIFFMLVCFIIVFSFSKSGMLMLFVVLIVLGLINYSSSKMWNIWCVNGQLYMENIYKTHIVSIKEFDKVELVNLFGYNLLLKGGEKYYFKVRPTDDIKVFFKNDSHFLAKEISDKINKIKENL